MKFDSPVKNNQALTDQVREISLRKFGKSFDHQAFWNNRLRTTGGRFFPRDLHLDFNPKMADLPEFEQVILHELVHYHLYRGHLGYQHKDTAFKTLLAQVGGLRYAPSLPGNKPAKPKLVYICQDCGQIYPRQRHINTKKYRCGRCHGKLLLK